MGYAISVIGFSKFLGGFVITIIYFAGAVQKLECEFLFIEIQQHPSCENLMAERKECEKLCCCSSSSTLKLSSVSCTGAVMGV